MKLEPAKIIRVIWSAFLTLFAIWTITTPSKPGTIAYNIQQITQRFDYMRYDLKLPMWIKKSHFNSFPIIIVTINDQTFNRIAKNLWEYDKAVHLIEILQKQNVAIVAPEIIFSHSIQNMTDALKKIFTKAKLNSLILDNDIVKLKNELNAHINIQNEITTNNNVVLPFFLNISPSKQGVLPKPILTLNKNDNKASIINTYGYITNYAELQNASKHNGFITLIVDDDGAIRRSPLVLRYGTQVYPSIALEITKMLNPKAQISLNTVKIGTHEYLKSIQIGNKKIPTDKNGQLYIPYYKNISTFKYYSEEDIFQHKFNPKDLKNAIVLIGSTSSYTLGFDRIFVNTASSNIEVQASILNSIFNNKYLYTPYWGQAVIIGITLGVGILLTFFLPLLGTGLSIFLTLIIQLSLIALNMLLFYNKGIVLSFSLPLALTLFLLVSNSIFAFIFENRKKIHLRKFFAQYVPPDYLQLLLEDPDTYYGFEGKAKNLSVLFADIHHFTSLSENLEASEVKKILNQFFTPMTSIILKHGGTVDKYIGDMVMAFFGAPLDNKKHAESAMSCALEMLTKTKSLQKSFINQGLPALELRIGINSGIMNVGDMGSEFRRAYTVIGDAVNLGSRIQRKTEYYGVDLLVGEETVKQQNKFIFRMIDKVKFKGKKEAINIYEVVCHKKNCTQKLLNEINKHETALNAYFARDWDLAIELFTQLEHKQPTYKVYKIFLNRSQYFKKHKPPIDWDGTHEFLKK